MEWFCPFVPHPSIFSVCKVLSQIDAPIGGTQKWNDFVIVVRRWTKGVQLDIEIDLSFGEWDQGSKNDGLNDLDNFEFGSDKQLNKVSFFIVFY